eukprot:m.30842 g.30842  ORF g.30842 m.30842 type:complete len:569 (-) comp8250_c0_seq1:176-1882(-)
MSSLRSLLLFAAVVHVQSQALQSEEWVWTRRYDCCGGRALSVHMHKVVNGVGQIDPTTKDKSAIQNGILGQAGKYVVIKRVGICGDADRSSGPVRWNVGGRFTMEAGQYNWGSNYRLNPVPGGRPSMGWSYRTITKTQFTWKQNVVVQFHGTRDNDGLYCGSADEDKVSYNDGRYSSSYRVWIKFDYVSYAPCPSLQYRPVPTQAACAKCKTCSSSQYIKPGTCQNFQNTECVTCSNKPSNEYYTLQPCEGYSDAKFAKCSADCKVSETFELIPCGSQNRMCKAIAPECTKDEYEARSPTKTENRLCLPRKVCNKEEYIISDGDKTTNRVCGTVFPACVAPAQYEVSPPTATTNRVCAVPTQCKDDEHETVAPTPISNRKCEPNTKECPDDSMYEEAPPTATSDLKCSPIREECSFPVEYESAAPTKTSNRGCSPVTTCERNQFELSRATPTSDAECVSLCYTCPKGQYESVPCDLTTVTPDPTICEVCDECGEGELEVQACTPNSNRKCENKYELARDLREAVEALEGNAVQTLDGNMIWGVSGEKVAVVPSDIVVNDMSVSQTLRS